MNDANLQRNIYLVGLMGSGKTTIGRTLAKRLEREFVDSDRVIEARTGVSIPTIFEIEGEDGFVLKGSSTMREISRDPLDLVAQTIGTHHQYPDGFMLFMGTLFAPVEDRDAPGQGFTHKTGDRVVISNAELGSLANTVRLSTECPPWTFGISALMRNLSARGLV